ncbi:hypothetical protein RFI_16829, partial [Reticulomyxa filosa]
NIVVKKFLVMSRHNFLLQEEDSGGHGNVEIDDENENENDPTSNNNNEKPKAKSSRNRNKNETMLTAEEKTAILDKCKIALVSQVSAICKDKIDTYNKDLREQRDPADKPDQLDEENKELVPLKVSNQFILSLTEFIFDTALVLSKDIQTFKAHRNKKTASVEDVLLFVRRNSDLKEQLEFYAETLVHKKNKSGTKNKKDKPKNDDPQPNDSGD